MKMQYFLHTYILIKVDRNLVVLKAFLNRRDTKIYIYCWTMLQMELNHRRKDARVTDHLFCLSKNWRRKQSLSMALSTRRDRILVMNSPAAEKALSASTEVGGTDWTAWNTLSIMDGRWPEFSKMANSRFTSCKILEEDAKSSWFSQCPMHSGRSIFLRSNKQNLWHFF